ncbi:MAG: hypothetical protein GF411_14780 [Candidatus Lokiarchaeota archaeon]|nr:hypothetical protein [Candidatus Lokiarchaeota archaeon]
MNDILESIKKLFPFPHYQVEEVYDDVIIITKGEPCVMIITTPNMYMVLTRKPHYGYNDVHMLHDIHALQVYVDTYFTSCV